MTCTIFNKSHLIDNRRRQKYTPILKALLNGSVIDIHPNYVPLYGNNNAIDCSTITNKNVIEAFLDGPKNEDAKSWPSIECSAGNVKLYHLQKTGQFSKSNSVAFTDTDIKESMVILFSEVLQMGYLQPNHIFVKDDLAMYILHIWPVAFIKRFLADPAMKKLHTWLDQQFDNPTTEAATVMQMAFSQACLLHEAYPNLELDRNSVYKQVRSLARQATNIRADKWNPGDVYVIVDAQSPMLSCIQQPEGYVPPIEEINNLFADEWSNTNRPLVSISLKLSDHSFGGKCKGLVRSYGSCPTNYHITRTERETSNNLLIDAIDSMRSTMSIHSPDLIYSGPLKWDIANQKTQKIHEKYAVLKLLSYIANVDPNLKHTIGQFIGYGMSLAGCNPTFFKVTGNKSNKATIDKYASNTTIEVVSPTIKVIDSNTSNAVLVECIVDKQGLLYNVVISIRTEGHGHPAIEIQRAQQLNAPTTSYSNLCGPISALP